MGGGGGGGLLVGVVLAVAAWLSIRRETWLRAVLAARIPLIGAAIVAIAPPLLIQTGPGSLAALFRLERSRDLALAGGLGLAVAWTSGLTALFVWQYAPRRLPDAGWPERPFANAKRRRWYLWWTAPALPLLSVLWLEAAEGQPAAIPLLLGLVTAALAALAVVGLRTLLVAPLLRWIERSRLAGPLRRLPRAVRDGYLVAEGDDRVRIDSGHLGATALLMLVVGVYAWCHTALRPDRLVGSQPAPLVYALMLIMLLVLVLSGLAFFLDRFRLPLTLVVLVWSFAVLGERNEHSFALEIAPPASPAPISVESSLATWAAQQPPDDPRPPMIVITAGGGGIRAAAWTSRVLAWLYEHPRLDSRVLRSTGLVSAVSGSSVGMTHVLETVRLAGGEPSVVDLRHAVDAASRSSLSETGWGIVFPDFLRLVAPWAVDPSIDRAWALEQAWRAAWNPSRPLDTRWSDWVGAGARGVIPAVVFNAFVVETGDRLLLSTTRIPDLHRAQTLDSLYGSERVRPDLDLVTAARLSATFPYVTPIASGVWADGVEIEDPPPEVSIADGGYADNQGLLTAIEWLRAALAPGTVDATGRPWSQRIGDVILIEIRAFGRSVPRAEPPHEISGSRRGWWSAVVGPLRGLLETRRTTQLARNELELGLLRDLHGARIRRLVIEPAPGDAPLSWHLSRAEIAALDAERPRVERAAEILAGWLETR